MKWPTDHIMTLTEDTFFRSITQGSENLVQALARPRWTSGYSRTTTFPSLHKVSPYPSILSVSGQFKANQDNPPGSMQKHMNNG